MRYFQDEVVERLQIAAAMETGGETNKLFDLTQALWLNTGSLYYHKLSFLPQALFPTTGSLSYHRLSFLPQVLFPTTGFLVFRPPRATTDFPGNQRLFDQPQVLCNTKGFLANHRFSWIPSLFYHRVSGFPATQDNHRLYGKSKAFWPTTASSA